MMNMNLIADLAVRHGWFADRASKTVWAVVADDHPARPTRQ
jgi:hypothetical protein